MRRRAEEVARLGGLEQPAAIHHADAVADHRDDAEIVSDQQDGRAVIATQAVDELQHLRLDGDIERRGRLVGDQQLWVVGKRRGNHNALALAAGETMRHVIVARRRVGDADLAHQRDGAGARLGRARRSRWARMVSAIWSPTGHVGSRLAEGSWKIIDTSSPRICRNASSPSPTISRPLSRMLPRHGGAGGQQAHHRVGQRALAASALTDDSEDLARLERERDRCDRRRWLHRVARAEADAEIGRG